MDHTFITPLQPLQSIFQANGENLAVNSGIQSGISSFKNIFEEAIDNVRTTDDALAKQQYLLATGQIEDPHTVMIASSEAQMAVDGADCACSCD